MHLSYCDRFSIETQYFRNMACSAIAQGGVGFSLGAINNILSSCHDVKSWNLTPIQASAVVGFFTAGYFKTHGCVYLYQRFPNQSPQDLSKCNEIADHGLNVFSSLGST
jgi:predicted membrane channel-forming protein YqfA (hemolysin III family)